MAAIDIIWDLLKDAVLYRDCLRYVNRDAAIEIIWDLLKENAIEIVWDLLKDANIVWGILMGMLQ